MYSIIHTNVPDVRNELHEKGYLPQDASVIMQVGTCAVLEIQTDQKYIYRAINIKTGQDRHLYSRSKPIERSRFNTMAEKIFRLPIYSDCDLPDAQSRAKALLLRIFYIIMPQHGFTFRQNQHHLACAMMDALWGHKLALCEAGVGSGKTLAYVVVAVLYGLFQCEKSSAVISTSTIALQKAITEDYLPQISEILCTHRVIERPISCVVRKGKAHYICDARLHSYLSSVTNLGKDQRLIEQLTMLREVGAMNIDLSLYPLSRYVKDRICVFGLCPQECPQRADCRYQMFTRLCMETYHDFSVTNHNYVLAHILNLKENRRELLPTYKLVIFDEAHKFIEAARQMYGSRFARSEIVALADSIPTRQIANRHDRRCVEGWLELFVKRNDRLFTILCSGAHSEQESTARHSVNLAAARQGDMASLVGNLEHLPVLCADRGGKIMRPHLHDINSRCSEIIRKVTAFMEQDNSIYWVEDVDTDPALCSIPKELEKLLFYDLWRQNTPYILTSGTLTADGCFSFVRHSLGVELLPENRVSSLSMPSPFDYKRNTLLYIPKDIPFPDANDPQYIATVAEEIRGLIDATHGHTLILCTSYWVMERLHGMLRNEIAQRFPVFIMGRGRVDTIARFKASTNGVLFASDAAGEGVDLAGDILSSLIIVRLPFPVTDPITEHEKLAYDNLKSYLQAVTVPSMLIKLKQYVGRAIRVETDTAVISILDSRVARGGKYRRAVLNALFATTVTDKITDVRAFIHRKKIAAYFE